MLDEVFYDALRKHPVPLREAALRELADRSGSLDLYIWLAYRLHTLKRPTPLRWAALQEQFGTHMSLPSNFRRLFRKRSPRPWSPTRRRGWSSPRTTAA